MSLKRYEFDGEQLSRGEYLRRKHAGKKLPGKLKKRDRRYRRQRPKRRFRQIPGEHYIYIFLVGLSLLCSITTHRAGLTRLIHSFRDLGTSVAMWFFSLFDVSDVVPETIMSYNLPEIVDFIGFNIDEFTRKLSELIPSLFVSEYFFGYLKSLSNVLELVGYALLLLLPFVLLFKLLISFIYLRDPSVPKDQRKLRARMGSCLRRWIFHHPAVKETDPLRKQSWQETKRFKLESKSATGDPSEEDPEDLLLSEPPSRQLEFFLLKILPKIQRAIKKVVSFWRFGKGFWHILLLLIWSINLNLVSIAVSAFATYFYVLATFSLSSLPFLFSKLLVDLIVTFASAPLLFWLVVGYAMLTYIRKYIARRRLHGHEKSNQEFIEDLPLSTLVTGWMAAGKTATITDMGLSFDAMMRDKALDLIYSIDLKFPDFPWRAVELTVEYAVAFHAIPADPKGNDPEAEDLACLRSLVTVRDFFNALRKHYNATLLPLDCFGYDAQTLKAFADDGLTVCNIFDAIVEYAQLYYIYQHDTSLLVSSYAVRGGVKRIDKGHFPLFETNFFDEKSFYRVGAADQMSHVIDYDMFRMGKKVDHRNPNIGLFEFGCCLMSEKGKERGNMVENQSFKKDDFNANPKNDGFDKDLKMRRHAGTVAFYCFCKFFSDEQRPESVGANEREVSQIIHMDGVHKEGVFCPFFTLTGALADVIRAKFKDFYYKYRNVRDDNTLLVYILKHITSAFTNYVDRYRNLYGYKIMQLVLEDGIDGEKRVLYYTLSRQKLYSGRYSTDCLKGIYVDQVRQCQRSLDDLPTYGDIVAIPDELKKQNSYFVNDAFKEQWNDYR